MELKKSIIRPSIGSLVPSATLLINERSKELISQGKKVFRLGFGQSPFPIPAEVVDSLRHYAGEKDYLPVQGLMPLRKAVSDYYKSYLQLEYPINQIMIGPGSKELILGLKMVCDADVLLPSPSWVSYEPQAHIVNSNVYWIDAEEKDGWRITPEKLDTVCKNCSDKQKILILNYPSNPVGVTYSKKDLKALSEVARKHALIVVADEIYGALTFEGSHHSLASFYPEGTIVSSGLSKWCGAGGWRLGTFCFPKELSEVLSAMMALASESFSAVSAPVQYAAIKAFEGSQAIEEHVKNSKKVLEMVAGYVYSELIEMSVTMPKAEGGFYLFPNFKNFKKALSKKGVNTSAEFCETLLVETGVALLPGSAFGRPAEEITCRLSYVDFDGAELLRVITESPEIDQHSLIDHCPSMKESMAVLKQWLKAL
ncbi:MAG: aminotransferase class I/II-fold pyridoxal phosphate-dependent enzyme [Cyclobacteriaceae bacterium]|nr:aminotransferase class I/II-fold pyridoxal phosphate-dependent enzyme [Cyclobacteriaceae bacterium]